MNPTRNHLGSLGVPEPPSTPFLGHLPQMRRAPLEFLLESSRLYGDIFRFRVGRTNYYVFVNASDVKFILQEGHSYFRKSPRYTRTMFQVLGNGLVSNEGGSHLRQRRIVQPVFRRDRVENLAGIMVRVAEEAATRWHRFAEQGHAVDVRDEMNELARRIVLQTLFGENLDPQVSSRIGSSIEELSWQLNQDILAPWRLPRWIPTPRNQRFKRSLRSVDDCLTQLVGSRREGNSTAVDLMSILMRARDDETGEPMTDALLRDETLTLFIAGHETTANALAWIWYLLSENPIAASRLREELQSELGGRSPTLESLPQLQYTRMVIEEALRLYPPAYMFDRYAKEEVRIGEVCLPPGSVVYVSPYLTHRKREYWDRPDEFYPEHFTPDRASSRPKYAYFPFGGGPRQCIGNYYAVIEMQLVIATLAQQFSLSMLVRQRPSPEVCITLRPPAGMMMRVHSCPTAVADCH